MVLLVYLRLNLKFCLFCWLRVQGNHWRISLQWEDMEIYGPLFFAFPYYISRPSALKINENTHLTYVSGLGSNHIWKRVWFHSLPIYFLMCHLALAENGQWVCKISYLRVYNSYDACSFLLGLLLYAQSSTFINIPTSHLRLGHFPTSSRISLQQTFAFRFPCLFTFSFNMSR